MSYHIVHIDSPSVRLTCRNGQLLCRTDENENRLAMEDIAAVVICSFTSTISSEVLLQAAEYGVAFIYCRNFKPVSLVLPANRSTDTHLTRAVINLAEKQKSQLWKRTVDAKCANQYAHATYFCSDKNKLDIFYRCALGRHPQKESTSARYYWRIFGHTIGQIEFVRSRGGGGINDLLNFGYAILLSLILRNLFAVGLDPTFGIFHKTRERATPLAYDLMEPFRPCIDACVLEWVAMHTSPAEWKVTADFKKFIIPILEKKIRYEGRMLSTRLVIERSVRSFRSAVINNRIAMYKPWILKNLKWDGC